jgi:putative endonuclease
MDKTNFTYMLRCSDGTLYTGWTTNLERRLKAHNQGTGAKYTRARRPVVLAYYEAFDTREEAMRREWQIKQLPRKEKLELIASGSDKRIHENIVTETSSHDKQVENLVRTEIFMPGIKKGQF